MDRLAKAAGHADRSVPLRSYCTGLLLPGEDYEGPGLCSEPTMMRLLEVSAAADVELRRLADRLEALLLQEFSTKLMRH